MWEVTASVLNRRISVPHIRLVHLLKNGVIFLAEQLQPAVDLVHVQLAAVFLPHFLRRSAQKLKLRFAALVSHRRSRLRALQLAVYLQIFAFGLCQVQRSNSCPLLVFPARGLRLVRVHGREILLRQRPRLRAIRHNVPHVAFHRFSAVKKPSRLVLPGVAFGNVLCRLARKSRAPLRVVFLHRRKAVLHGFLCGIYTQNTASVFSLYVLRVDIAAQQLVHRPAVLLC